MFKRVFYHRFSHCNLSLQILMVSSHMVESSLIHITIIGNSDLKSNNKIMSIHYLRGLAALAVVFFHLRENLNNVYAQKNLGDLLFLSGAGGVDIFFIVSGFIIALSTKNKMPKNATNFFLKRFFRIYPPYIIMLLAYCYFVMPSDWITFIKSALLIQLNYASEAPFFGYSILLPSWTLTYEIYFYMIFMVAMSISHKYRTLLCILLLMVPMYCLQYHYNGNFDFYGKAAANINDPSLPAGFLRLASSPMLIEFVYGMMIYECRSLLKKIPFVNVVAFLCVSFYISCFLSGWRFFYGPVNFGLWAIILVIGVMSYEAQKGLKENKALSFLGDISYSLYISHAGLITVIGTYWPDMPVYVQGPGIGRFVLLTSLSISFAYLIFRYVETPSINIGKMAINKICK